MVSEHTPILMQPTILTPALPIRIDSVRCASLPLPGHARIAPYASTLIRLVFQSKRDLERFQRLWEEARVNRKIFDYEHRIERRNLYSTSSIASFEQFGREMPWNLAFQLEALVRNGTLDPIEALSLKPHLEEVIKGQHEKFNYQRDLFWNPTHE